VWQEHDDYFWLRSLGSDQEFGKQKFLIFFNLWVLWVAACVCGSACHCDILTSHSDKVCCICYLRKNQGQHELTNQQQQQQLCVHCKQGSKNWRWEQKRNLLKGEKTDWHMVAWNQLIWDSWASKLTIIELTCQATLPAGLSAMTRGSRSVSVTWPRISENSCSSRLTRMVQ